MLKYCLFLVFLMFSSCSKYVINEDVCSTTYSSAAYLKNSAIKPVEIIKCDTLIRIWIDNNTSKSAIITLYKNGNNYFGTYTELGLEFQKRFLVKRKERGIYKQNSICPSSGWKMFFKKLDGSCLYNVVTQQLNPNEAFVHGQQVSIILVEIVAAGIKKSYNFYSFYPVEYSTIKMKEYYDLMKLFDEEFQIPIFYLETDSKN